MPVFNTRNYLTRALDSILSQTLNVNDYELIIINDGSFDGSEKILAAYAAKYPNLVLVNQLNQGEAKSRNIALQLVKGEYLAFIDSDDAIYSDSLNAILNYLEKNNIDLLYLNIHSYNYEGQFIKETSPIGNQGIVQRGFLHARRTFPATIYKASLIKNLEFPQGIIVGPDTVFNVKAQSFAERVSYFDLPYYQYTVRENSLSKQGKSQKAFEGFLKAINDLRKFQKENFDGNSEAVKYFDDVYEIFVTRILELNVIPDWNKKNYDRLKEILATENLLYVLDQFSQKYPYSNRSFISFAAYQKYLSFKSKIHKLIYRA